MATISKDQLVAIGTAMYGQKWRGALASQLDLSYPRIAQIAAQEQISGPNARRILDLYTKWQAAGGTPVVQVERGPAVIVFKEDDADLTDQAILERITKRFSVMGRMVDGMIDGKIRSLIVYGAPGIGKSFELEKRVKEAHRKQGLEYSIIRGTVSAPGLYQALHAARNGGIVVLDDADSIFNDEQAFNIMKTALDTTNERIIAWRKQSAWVYNVNDDMYQGEDDVIDDRFPNEFMFKGSIVFITNIDMKAKVLDENRFSPHFNALISRSHYLDLTLSSQRAKILRIKDVFLNQMRKANDLTEPQAKEILEFAMENKDRLNELSLRMMKHVSDLYKLGDDWKEIVEFTKMNMPRGG
jgi:hypothetical protein